MRRFSILNIILAFAVSTPLAAENETAKLLRAVHIDSGLYMQVDGTSLQYQVDGKGKFIGFESDEKKIDTFTGDRQVDFVFVRFNPLKYTIQTKEDLRDDASAAAVAEFLKKLVETASGVVPFKLDDVTALTESIARLNTSLDTRMADVQRGERSTNAESPNPCDRYDALHGTLVDLDDAMRGSSQGTTLAAEVKSWEETATGRTGVDQVRGRIATIGEAIEANATKVDELVARIDKEFRKSTDDEPRCGRIRASTFALLFDISHKAADAHASNLALRKDLAELHKALELYTNEARWIGGDAYIFLKPRIDPEKIATVSVTVTPRTLSLVSNKLQIKEGTPVKTKFDLRQYRAVVTEVIPALIYTDLAYPKYGTDESKDEPGVIRVKKGKDSRFPVEGAIMLNMLWSRLGTSIVYPSLQIGVSSAKDFPGFLGGVGFRFVGRYPVSLSIGRMVTWYKDLDALEEGSIVNGTADIEKDLKLKRSPVAWYGAIQYKF